MTEWNAAVTASGTTLDTVDITVALAVLMAGKDADELVCVSRLATARLTLYHFLNIVGI